MKHWSLSATAATALALSAGQALAITPEEVWTAWKDQAAKSGATMTAGAETRNGAALEITDITATMLLPEGDGQIGYSFDRLVLTDRGDGTVEVKPPESFPVTLSDEVGAAAKPDATLTISQPGASIIASGTVEAISYEFTAPSVKVALTEAVEDGHPIDAKFDAEAKGISGKYLVAPKADGASDIDSSFAMEGLAFTASGSNPESNETFAAKGSVGATTSSAKGTILSQEAMQDMAAALKAGFNIDTKSTTGAIALDVDFTDAGGTGKLTASFAGSDVSLAMDAARLAYGFALGAGSISVNAPAGGMPPVDVSFTETAFNLVMPVTKTDTPQDFSFLTRLVDLTVSDSVWGMIDPGAQLARDPATLILDLKGTGAWAVEILDPKVQSGETPSPDMPGTLNSLDLTQALLKLVGAEANAVGALTFDNTDLTTFGGVPAPTGKITVNLKGVNTLIDKLVAMGLLPADQVTGARMMLAMFAKPGAGPDELISEIEFKDKALFVNGQQLM